MNFDNDVTVRSVDFHGVRLTYRPGVFYVHVLKQLRRSGEFVPRDRQVEFLNDALVSWTLEGPLTYAKGKVYPKKPVPKSVDTLSALADEVLQGMFDALGKDLIVLYGLNGFGDENG